MRGDPVSAFEVSRTGAGARLVGTQVPESVTEMTVPMPLDLLVVCVPVTAVLYPTEDWVVPVQVCERFRLAGVVVPTAVIPTAVAVVVTEIVAISA